MVVLCLLLLHHFGSYHIRKKKNSFESIRGNTRKKTERCSECTLISLQSTCLCSPRLKTGKNPSSRFFIKISYEHRLIVSTSRQLHLQEKNFNNENARHNTHPGMLELISSKRVYRSTRSKAKFLCLFQILRSPVLVQVYRKFLSATKE
jgi:hypothetical protein